jgi:transcriptional regulator with XRE-family HTH domain
MSSDVPRQALRASALFGASVRGAREALGLTQASCARSMGVTKNCLHNLESGTDARMSTALLALAMLGAAMRAMRLEIGLSEAQLAQQAGLDPALAAGIEAGVSLDMAALTAMAAAFKALASASSIAALKRGGSAA